MAQPGEDVNRDDLVLSIRHITFIGLSNNFLFYHPSHTAKPQSRRAPLDAIFVSITGTSERVRLNCLLPFMVLMLWHFVT